MGKETGPLPTRREPITMDNLRASAIWVVSPIGDKSTVQRRALRARR